MKKIKVGLAILCAVAVGSALLMTACSPKAQDNNGERGSKTETAWSAEMDCTLCHAMGTCDLEKTHLATGTCVSCHTVNDALTTVHEGATADEASAVTSLKKTKISSELCQTCHKLFDLATKTAACTALTDSKGKTVNPHDLPDGHLIKNFQCFDCHVVHENGNLEKTAQELCISCHHEEVYECNTCH